MQLKIANKKVVRFTHEANIAGEVIIQEYSLGLILRGLFIVHNIALCNRVVVIKCVYFFGLSEIIFSILLSVKLIHEDKSRRNWNVE